MPSGASVMPPTVQFESMTAGVLGRNQKQRCQPLHPGADVHKAVDAIVHKVGEVEASEQHALALHATAVAAEVDVLRESRSAQRVPTSPRSS